jgi:hypothetical protein
LLTVYFLLFGFLNIQIDETTMFATHDSGTYLNVAQWIQGTSDSTDIQIRPYLYPAILLVLYEGTGPYGLWLFQFLCWIISINLIFLSIKRFSPKKIFAFIGAGFAALNFSYVLLTFHALPEVVTTFLLSVCLYYISGHIKNWQDTIFFQTSMLILVLLAVLKPLFFLVVLFQLLVIFPIFYLRQYMAKPRQFFVLLLVLSPLILQIIIMKINFDSWNVSKIGGNTFRDYFFAEGIQQINQIKYEDAVKKAREFSPQEQLKFILAHKLTYLNLYLGNLKENIDGEPVFLEIPVFHKSIYKFTSNLNTLYFYLHLLFLLPVIITILKTIRDKESEFAFLLLGTAFILYFVLLTSGISFWQGDRLVMPGLPVWIILYFLVIHYWRVRISGRRIR